jgi:tetratricopeptide (TPR) repeat protein
MYHYVLNYSIKMINQGDRVHRKVLLENYKQMMAQQILIQDGQISQWHYKNVVTICLRQDETAFANTFIHTYRKFLSADVRENAFQYNAAYLQFAKGQYKDAISGLQKVDLDDVYYRLDARSILLKSYYELNDIDALFYQASSFRMFIRRNKSISAYQKAVYLNLIKITLALVRAGSNITRLKRVKDRVERDSRIADLQWVESKLEELGA